MLFGFSTLRSKPQRLSVREQDFRGGIEKCCGDWLNNLDKNMSTMGNFLGGVGGIAKVVMALPSNYQHIHLRRFSSIFRRLRHRPIKYLPLIQEPCAAL